MEDEDSKEEEMEEEGDGGRFFLLRPNREQRDVRMKAKEVEEGGKLTRRRVILNEPIDCMLRRS